MSDLIGSLETLFVRQGWTAKIERRQQAAPDCQGAKDAAVTDEKSPSEREDTIYWTWPYTGCW